MMNKDFMISNVARNFLRGWVRLTNASSPLSPFLKFTTPNHLCHFYHLSLQPKPHQQCDPVGLYGRVGLPVGIGNGVGVGEELHDAPDDELDDDASECEDL
jgi:hypothetical protein